MNDRVIEFTLTNKDFNDESFIYFYYTYDSEGDDYKVTDSESEYTLSFGLNMESMRININGYVGYYEPYETRGISGEIDITVDFYGGVIYDDVFDEDDPATVLSIMTDKDLFITDNFRGSDSVMMHYPSYMRKNSHYVYNIHKSLYDILINNFDIIRYNIWMTAYEFYDENISYKTEYLEYYPKEIQDFIENEIEDFDNIDDEELTEFINKNFYQIFDNPVMGG